MIHATYIWKMAFWAHALVFFCLLVGLIDKDITTVRRCWLSAGPWKLEEGFSCFEHGEKEKF